MEDMKRFIKKNENIIRLLLILVSISYLMVMVVGINNFNEATLKDNEFMKNVLFKLMISFPFYTLPSGAIISRFFEFKGVDLFLTANIFILVFFILQHDELFKWFLF